MDLSVLEGDDPAGYRAEKKIQEFKKRAEDPFAHKTKRPNNPGHSSDVVQRSSYRRNRQKDLDKLNFQTKKRSKEAHNQEYLEMRQQISQSLEEKTAKKRSKRLAKREKKAKKVSGSPHASQPNKL